MDVNPDRGGPERKVKHSPAASRRRFLASTRYGGPRRPVPMLSSNCSRSALREALEDVVREVPLPRVPLAADPHAKAREIRRPEMRDHRSEAFLPSRRTRAPSGAALRAEGRCRPRRHRAPGVRRCVSCKEPRPPRPRRSCTFAGGPGAPVRSRLSPGRRARNTPARESGFLPPRPAPPRRGIRRCAGSPRIRPRDCRGRR